MGVLADQTIAALPSDARIIPDGFGGTAGFLLPDGTRIYAFRMEWSLAPPPDRRVTVAGISMTVPPGALGLRAYNQDGRLIDEAWLPDAGVR